MVVRESKAEPRDDIDRLFHALADATRRDILRQVLNAEHSVSALADRYPMSFAAIQKHVAVLERAALVTKQRKGREQLVQGNIDTIRRAEHLLDRYEAIWRSRIDQMDAILAEPDAVPHPTPIPTPKHATDRRKPR